MLQYVQTVGPQLSVKVQNFKSQKLLLKFIMASFLENLLFFGRNLSALVPALSESLTQSHLSLYQSASQTLFSHSVIQSMKVILSDSFIRVSFQLYRSHSESVTVNQRPFLSENYRSTYLLFFFTSVI